MPKVYISNKGGHDYSAAEKFGEIVYMSEGLIPPRAQSRMERQFAPIIEQASPDDWVMITGMTSLTGIVIGMLLWKFGKVNTLTYYENKYYPHTFVAGQLLTREEEK